MFVKICGITNEDDALLCAGLGADAIGLVFAASSRRVSSGVARDIVRRLPPEILTVGVFRNERKERVVEMANKIGCRAVQLHGHESPDDTRWIAARVPAVVRAFAAGDPALQRIDDYGDVRVLIDSPEPGSGKAFDWRMLRDSNFTTPFLLAGGLTPENVGSAISMLRPAGVDVSSGVESRPGVKDPVKVAHFITAARKAVPPDDDQYRTHSSSDPNGPYNWEDDA